MPRNCSVSPTWTGRWWAEPRSRRRISPRSSRRRGNLAAAMPPLSPNRPVIGFQRWDRLLFLHFEVPEEAIRARVPERLEVDTFGGRAFVSATPFTVAGARLRGGPPPPAPARLPAPNLRAPVRNGGH